MARNPILKTTAEMICVLYAPDDGRIVHTHSVVTLTGGKTVTEAELERRARERTGPGRKKGRGTSGVASGARGLFGIHTLPGRCSKSEIGQNQPAASMKQNSAGAARRETIT